MFLEQVPQNKQKALIVERIDMWINIQDNKHNRAKRHCMNSTLLQKQVLAYYWKYIINSLEPNNHSGDG